MQYDNKVCEELRHQILHDKGNPQIREKVLNLISDIENENKRAEKLLLYDSKNGNNNNADSRLEQRL